MTDALHVYLTRVKTWFNPQRRGHLSVFFTCLAISFLLWILIRFSQNVSTSLEYPVILEDVPADMLLTGKSDSVFYVRMDSRGWDLLSLKKILYHPEVIVNLRNVQMKQQNGKYVARIPTGGIEERIAHELGAYNNMLSLSPDTLYLYFQPLYSKKVPVVSHISYMPGNQFYLYDSVSITPDSIIISGLKQEVDSVMFIPTATYDFGTLRERKTGKLALIKPSSLYEITLSADSINVEIPIEQYTEAVVTVPITTVNRLNDKIIKTFPETVEIRYLVALKDFNSISNDAFRVDAIYNDASAAKLKVELIYSPRKCIVRKIVPENVEFIFMK